MIKTSHIRNFCIIAHIDHGKSTLSDRLLETTNTIDKRNMKEQLLDQMELEQERGITIKLQPATMMYKQGGKEYMLNLIDTPGHIDFTYEVSRSLSAVEGAVLLVDATQGIQAQTLGNWYLAESQNLKIIPVLNKIDLPAADVKTHSKALAELLGIDESEILSVSGKTGEGVDELLKKIIEEVPQPEPVKSKKPRALIFDSFYDDFVGVVAYVRMVEGNLNSGDKISFCSNNESSIITELGIITPDRKKLGELSEGQIGYIITGLKDLGTVRVGDTIKLDGDNTTKPLEGFQEIKPMVYASIYSKDGDAFTELREAFEKLKLNDAALSWEIEQSVVLGYGVRAGFLGMLHLEIIQERLRREFNLETIVSVPSVSYNVLLSNESEKVVTSATDWPNPSNIDTVMEPWIKAEIFSPESYLGALMQFLHERRGNYLTTTYLTKAAGRERMAVLTYEMPLSVILVDFYDNIKSISSGFASFSYELIDYRAAEVVRMDILLAEEMQEELSMIVYKDESYQVGKRVVRKLKELLPRQQFVLKIQAAIGGKVIASERLSAMRKDVTAKLYGGDVTRKRKLLEKQKKGKKKMANISKGKVSVPSDVYVKLLKS